MGNMLNLRRLLSGSAKALEATANAPAKIHPTLAAKQFPKPGASARNIEALKRKEARLKRQIVRDVNNIKQHELRRAPFMVDPVLGDPENLFLKRMREEIADPSNIAHGYSRQELEKLLYGAQKAALDGTIGGQSVTEQIRIVEEKKKRALLTILNMKNTNKADKRRLAIAFARREFQREEGDTGSPEVQAAVMTVKIHFGFEHVQAFPKDKEHIQVVRELVQQRQSILRYLKRQDPEKYYYTIAKLGLTDDVVTTEFSMSKQYFQDYKVWGDKKLVKLSEKQLRKEQKFVDLQKKVDEYHKLAQTNYAQLSQ